MVKDPFSNHGGNLWFVEIHGGEMSSHGPCKIDFSAKYHYGNPYKARRITGEIINSSPKGDIYENVINHLMLERLKEEGKLDDVRLYDVGVAIVLRPNSLTLQTPWPEYEVKVHGKAALHGKRGFHSLMKFSMYFDRIDFPGSAGESEIVSVASEQILKVLERGGLEVPPKSKWSVVIFNKKTDKVKVVIVNAYDEVGAMSEAMKKEDISDYLLLHPRIEGNHMTFDPDVKIIATKVD